MQHRRSWHGCGCIVGRRLRLALGLTQGRSVDVNRLALVSQAAEQGLGQVFIAEQACPLVVLKVRGDECGLAAVALFHQFEKNVRLLGTQIEIPDFIDQEDVETGPGAG